jgi:hypothetical protein
MPDLSQAELSSLISKHPDICFEGDSPKWKKGEGYYVCGGNLEVMVYWAVRNADIDILYQVATIIAGE